MGLPFCCPARVAVAVLATLRLRKDEDMLLNALPGLPSHGRVCAPPVAGFTTEKRDSIYWPGEG